MEKPETNTEARRFLREFLMYRYSQLLLNVTKHQSMTEQQKSQLYKKILNLEWIDTAFQDN
jgi:hypothetical protein